MAHGNGSSISHRPDPTATVAIVGGGVAGLACAVRLTQQGVPVELFEASRRLGGRAGSFLEPKTGRWTDHGQHVSMGCCTALAAILNETELSDTFVAHRDMNFIAPDGRHTVFSAARWLPAPLHLLPSLGRLRFLSRRQRWQIVHAINALRRTAPDADDEPIADWLTRHAQSEKAIRQFWSPVLVSALSETLDRASLRASHKVIVDGLLASRRAYELQIPRLPLIEIFDRRLGDWLTARGVRIHRLTRVARIECDQEHVTQILLRDGQAVRPRAVVVAVPWHGISRLFSKNIVDLLKLDQAQQLRPAAITTVHLRYDRPITELAHAVLVDRLSQWVFRCGEHDYQVVISASHTLGAMTRDELAARVQRELGEVWPAARNAQAVHRRVVVQPRAVFSVTPNTDRLRPLQSAPLTNLALSGDWTQTGWPGTMESAVRSGNAAADAILEHL